MSNDWIEHNGGPQPVGDDVWVECLNAVTRRGWDALDDDQDPGAVYEARAEDVEWVRDFYYRILNQHLINEKQAEIDKLYAFLKQMREWDQLNPPISGDHKNFADQIDKILNK